MTIWLFGRKNMYYIIVSPDYNLTILQKIYKLHEKLLSWEPDPFIMDERYLAVLVKNKVGRLTFQTKLEMFTILQFYLRANISQYLRVSFYVYMGLTSCVLSFRVWLSSQPVAMPASSTLWKVLPRNLDKSKILYEIQCNGCIWYLVRLMI